jgi:hypothetical protein
MAEGLVVYEEFAARRRALLEAEAEREQHGALEDAANSLSKGNRSKS